MIFRSWRRFASWAERIQQRIRRNPSENHADCVQIEANNRAKYTARHARQNDMYVSS